MGKSEGSLIAATECPPSGISNGTGVVDGKPFSGAGSFAAAAAAAVDFLFLLPVCCCAGSC